MASYRIVLVGTEKELNLGACARAMKNFGFKELVLVSPECNPKGFVARKYAKHALDVLENAQVAESLENATRDCELVVGTTGIIQRFSDALKEPVTPKILAEKMRSFPGKTALVFGREGMGLNEKELKQCAIVVSIPANREYPVLNLSHALAVVLYELHALKKPRMIRVAGRRERESLEAMFGQVVELTGEWRNGKKITLAFKRVLSKSILTQVECNSLLGVLRRASEKLKAGETGKSSR